MLANVPLRFIFADPRATSTTTGGPRGYLTAHLATAQGENGMNPASATTQIGYIRLGNVIQAPPCG